MSGVGVYISALEDPIVVEPCVVRAGNRGNGHRCVVVAARHPRDRGGRGVEKAGDIEEEQAGPPYMVTMEVGAPWVTVSVPWRRGVLSAYSPVHREQIYRPLCMGECLPGTRPARYF